MKRDFDFKLKLKNINLSVDYDFATPRDNFNRNPHDLKYDISVREKKFRSEFSKIEEKSSIDIGKCFSKSVTPRADMKNDSKSSALTKFQRLSCDIMNRVNQSMENSMHSNLKNLTKSNNFSNSTNFSKSTKKSKYYEYVKQSLPGISDHLGAVNPTKPVIKLDIPSPKFNKNTKMEPIAKPSYFFNKPSENFANKIKMQPLGKIALKIDITKNQLGSANIDLKSENNKLLSKKVLKPLYAKNLENNEIKISRPKKDFTSLPALKHYHIGLLDTQKNLQNLSKKITSK